MRRSLPLRVFDGAEWKCRIGSGCLEYRTNYLANRQREFLADAAVVQYTRDAQGLSEALQILLSSS